MAKKILDKLNELDVGSEVSPQEFQNVWGMSKEEHLNRMMDYVHKRKAEAAGEEKLGEADLKRQVAELTNKVRQLEAELDFVKNAFTAYLKTSAPDYLNTYMRLRKARNTSELTKYKPFEFSDGLYSMSSMKDGVFFKQLSPAMQLIAKRIMDDAYSSISEKDDLEDVFSVTPHRKRKK